MIFSFLAFQAVQLTPLDILDRIVAKKGWGFVPATNRAMEPISYKREADNTVLGNVARKWNLDYKGKNATVSALALPMGVVFPSDSFVQGRYAMMEPVALKKALVSRSGKVLRVKELLLNCGIPETRCHWVYWDRLIVARVDPDRMEAALPDLASSLGARYDPKRKAIDFDAARFRTLLIQSASEASEPPNSPIPLRAPLAVLAVNQLTDNALAKIYEDDNPKLVTIPLVGKAVNPIVADYIERRMAPLRKAGLEAIGNIDFDVAPQLHYSPVNGVAVCLTYRNGNKLVI